MTRNSLPKEYLLYGVLLIVGTVALVKLDTFDSIYAFSRAHEDWELDEFILAIPIIVICLALFSFNRVRELRARANELEQAREALDETNKQLMEMAKDREHFIAVSCHELKSPLNGIIHSLDLLEMARNKEEREEGFGLAKSAARGLKAVIDGVLEFSRLYDTGDRHRVRFSPREMVDTIRTLARFQADAKGLALSITLDGSVPESILANEAGLRLAILNLVGNSVKYTEKGEVTVALAVETSGDALEMIVTVADTGIGIPQNEIESIFEPYKRTSLATGPGFGLGLTIVRRLVEGMEGTITVSSTVGQGTEFVLRLPVELA